MPTLTPDDWRDDPNAWTPEQVLAVIAFNVAWIGLVVVVWILETLFTEGKR